MTLETQIDTFEEVSNCPICQSVSGKKVFSFEYEDNLVVEKLEISGDVPTVSLLKCIHCGHCYTSPQITESVFDIYYSRMNSVFHSVARLDGVDYYKLKHLSILRKIEKLKRSGKVLDIGCGSGHFLAYFDEKRWERYGVEPSPLAAAKAKDIPNATIFNGFLDKTTFPCKFDVIVMLDVLEHLKKPDALLELIHFYLMDGGIVLLGTGNIESWAARLAREKWSYFCSWEHISFITRRSAHFLLRKTGFDVLRIDRMNNIDIRQVLFWRSYLQSMIGFSIQRFPYLGQFWKKGRKVYYSFGKDHYLIVGVKNPRSSELAAQGIPQI